MELTELDRQKKPSEELLDIVKQPEQSCPEIDKALKEVNQLLRDIKDAQYYIKHEDWNGIENAIDSIEYNAYDLENYFEYCRSQCDSIRSWGEEWKRLAKKMINEYEPELLQQNYKE